MIPKIEYKEAESKSPETYKDLRTGDVFTWGSQLDDDPKVKTDDGLMWLTDFTQLIVVETSPNYDRKVERRGRITGYEVTR